MTRRYGSFLVRYWHFGDDALRIEIEHIQSGERTLVASVAAAVAWISARGDNPAIERPVAPDREGQTTGTMEGKGVMR